MTPPDRRRPLSVMLLAALLASPAQAAPDEPAGAAVAAEGAPEPAARQALASRIADQLRAGIKSVKSTECRFFKKEYKQGPLEPSESTMKTTSRGDVYIRFIKGANEGREILFRPGKNDEKLLVTNPLFNLRLEPDGRLAMRNDRHTIHMAGMHAIARLILDDHERLKNLSADAMTFQDLGRRRVGEDWAHCYAADADRKQFPELYAEKTEFCVAEQFDLPVEIKEWQHEDGEEREVGHYRFEGCELNHLTDEDFDPQNPAYGF